MLYCTEHAATSISRATGHPADLEALLRAAREREERVEREYWTHIHWPVGGRIDDIMELVQNEVTPRRDQGVCGVYVRVRFMARELREVTCRWCKYHLRRAG